MKTLLRNLFGFAAILILGFTTQTTIRAQGRILIQDRLASINGVKLHYLVAGKGEPVILLHGYAENSHMWRPLMLELARTRLVIAPICVGSANPPSQRRVTTRRRWLRIFMPSRYPWVITARSLSVTISA